MAGVISNPLNINSFEIVQSGTIPLASGNFKTVANSYGVGTGFVFPIRGIINHNLGYVPAYLAYVDGGDSFGQLPFKELGGVGSNYYAEFTYSVNVTATQIIAQVDGFGYNTPGFGASGFDSGAFTVRYFLLRETAN